MHEAVTMQKVPAQSHCTFSASAVGTSADGLFRSRDPRMLDIPTVCFSLEEYEKYSVLGECVLRDKSLWDREVTDGHVSKRGWNFQQRLLAPGILYFGRYQLLWECPNGDACESHLERLPRLIQIVRSGMFESERLISVDTQGDLMML